MVSVPPKRTPPNMANCRRRSSSRRIILRKFLSQRTVMPYSATPPKPAITRLSSGSRRPAGGRGAPGARLGDVADRPEAGAPAEWIDARDGGFERLDLQSVDADHRVPVVHQMMGER